MMAATMSRARAMTKDGYPQSNVATRLGHGAAEAEHLEALVRDALKGKGT